MSESGTWTERESGTAYENRIAWGNKTIGESNRHNRCGFPASPCSACKLAIVDGNRHYRCGYSASPCSACMLASDGGSDVRTAIVETAGVAGCLCSKARRVDLRDWREG